MLRTLYMFAALALRLALYGITFATQFWHTLPIMDAWEVIPLIQHWDSGSLSVSELFTQHNEHRAMKPFNLSEGWSPAALAAADNILSSGNKVCAKTSLLMLGSAAVMPPTAGCSCRMGPTWLAYQLLSRRQAPFSARAH
jgi:hypothetical protein